MQYSLKIGEQMYSVTIADISVRPVIVEVDGERFEVWPEETAASDPKIVTRISSQPVSPSSRPCPPEPMLQATVMAKCVAAPIPGVIVAINVKSGQTVKRGEELCVLEAMKMKNSIRAGRDGMIEVVSIAVGEQVRHGQTLFEYTD
jgi:glutaconyl-CoA/methylmalonyl-CoA decarboxylase subunit gamma